MANIVTDLIEQAEDIKHRKWCSDKDCAKVQAMSHTESSGRAAYCGRPKIYLCL